MIESSMLIPNLHQGSRPPMGRELREAGFHVLVLTADTYQPPEKAFPGIAVLRCPLDDVEQGSEAAAHSARSCAGVVASLVRRGANVLVTCEEGRNRSGLVSAFALMELGAKPARAIMHIREKRLAPTGPALSNKAFVREILLSQLSTGRPGRNP